MTRGVAPAACRRVGLHPYCEYGCSMANSPAREAGLFDDRGRRKYLTGDERRRFLLASAQCEARTRALCRLLVYSGCRVSEALQLTRDRLDATAGHVVLRTLKRRKTVFRAVPLPDWLLAELLALPPLTEEPEQLFGWCRQTAWRRVREVMAQAAIAGAQAMPKGLRHGFGIATAEHNIPGGLVQRWMGHSRLETTAIYQDAAGNEERAFAARLWQPA